MTIEATTNPADAGSALVQPSNALNDPANWDFAEPDDEQANESAPATGIDPNRETDEAASGQESEDPAEQQAAPEDEAEGEAETATSEVTVPDDALVTLENGEKIRFGDLRKAPMLEQDYRRKTQNLSNEVREVRSLGSQIKNIVSAFAEYVQKQLPAQPDPMLAWQDPTRYTQQKVLYDAAVQNAASLIELGSQASQAVEHIDSKERDSTLAAEYEKLVTRMPTLNDPKSREAFNKSAWDAAIEIGFTPEENNRTTDHRHMLMAYWAAKGLAAERAKKTLAQKTVNAPKATPVKQGGQKGNPQFLRNKEAMRRLAKSGSIADAMAIDFE